MRVAVLVPCYNEEAAVGRVVADFRQALPAGAFGQQFNERPARTKIARIPGASDMSS
jgi:hypothetical protein